MGKEHAISCLLLLVDSHTVEAVIGRKQAVLVIQTAAYFVVRLQNATFEAHSDDNAFSNVLKPLRGAITMHQGDKSNMPLRLHRGASF